MGEFKIHSPYQPTGDQPQAIEQLVAGFRQGVPAQTLLGVTGSGKTFTMAKVIERMKKVTFGPGLGGVHVVQVEVAVPGVVDDQGGVGAGEGLLKVGSSLVPFVNRFPKNTKLYKLMTTKPSELHSQTPEMQMQLSLPNRQRPQPFSALLQAAA